MPKIPFSGSDTCKIGEGKPSGKYFASKRRRIEHNLYKQDHRGGWDEARSAWIINCPFSNIATGFPCHTKLFGIKVALV